MHFRVFVFCILASVILCLSCDSKDSPKSATPGAAMDEIGEVKPAAPRKLPAPPGEPGPVLIRLADSFPTQIFGAAASENKIAIAIQSDTRNIELCPETELPVCFRGIGIITDRLNPNEPKLVQLYESDTQSGARIEGIAAAKDRFVFAINDGVYVGDSHRTQIAIVNAQPQVERKIDLASPDLSVSQISLSSWTNDRVLVCAAFEPVQGKPGVRCEALDPETGKVSPVATISTQNPVRTFSVGTSGEHALVVWVESGHAKAAFLENAGDVLELGLSTTNAPHVAAGLDDFAVVWQGDDALMRVDRIPIAGALKNIDRRTILLNGLDYRTIGGLVAVSEGYLFAFRHQNTQQMALVTADFEGWHLLEDNQVWRMLSGYGSLDIQEAHTGKIFWQTAESLVGIK